MARFRLLVAVGILALGSTSLETHAQSQDDVAKQFVGMWRLVSFPIRLADGTSRQSRYSVAYIIYTDTTPIHMCFVAMDPNRPRWKSETAPTESEAISVLPQSYCSTVEIHAREGFVVHHVEIADIPNLIGQNRKRWFTFEGPNRVSLRVDPTELHRPLSRAR